MSDIDDLLSRLAEAPPDAGVWSVRVSTLRELLRLYDEARARAAHVEARATHMAIAKDGLAQDLARVTAERDESNDAINRLRSGEKLDTIVIAQTIRNYESALAAKLARCEAALRATVAAIDALEGEPVMYTLALQLSGASLDAKAYFAEQEPRT